ncbi:hypothetical protein C8F04DRAFT_1232638 [Mycena alexandri]|uniref:Uncharacterized protein n=1 Tax=Mycena alexandri TaxID=1745969 RepID=A0AAD6T1B8_9AGAR|nr:hypothetical protein C8F04DRAFT_1232638 [Mycena alexandri]
MAQSEHKNGINTLNRSLGGGGTASCLGLRTIWGKEIFRTRLPGILNVLGDTTGFSLQPKVMLLLLSPSLPGPQDPTGFLVCFLRPRQFAVTVTYHIVQAVPMNDIHSSIHTNREGVKGPKNLAPSAAPRFTEVPKPTDTQFEESRHSAGFCYMVDGIHESFPTGPRGERLEWPGNVDLCRVSSPQTSVASLSDHPPPDPFLLAAEAGGHDCVEPAEHRPDRVASPARFRGGRAPFLLTPGGNS